MSLSEFYRKDNWTIVKTGSKPNPPQPSSFYSTFNLRTIETSSSTSKVLTDQVKPMILFKKTFKRY